MASPFFILIQRVAVGLLLLGCTFCASAAGSDALVGLRGLVAQFVIRPAARPSIDSQYCQRIVALSSAGYQSSDAGVGDFLASPVLRSLPDNSSKVIRFASEEFQWWLGALHGTLPGGVWVEMGTAFHESVHWVRKVMEACAGDSGLARYYLGGRVFEIPRMSGLGSVANIEGLLGDEYKANTMRWRHYVNSASPGNDLYIVMDELIAYVEGAHFDIAIAKLTGGGGALVDANYGGALDFMIFSSAYLLSICKNDMTACAKLKSAEFRNFYSKVLGRFADLEEQLALYNLRVAGVFGYADVAKKEMLRQDLVSVRALFSAP